MKKTPLYKLDLDVYEETLENGLKIFVIPKKQVNNVYATFSTKYGSIQNEFIPINERKMIKVPDGVAHFLEHKVFEQVNGYDPFAFYTQSGSDCNANTSNYKTTYLFIGQDNILENINYLLDFVQTPYFTDENVEKEKGIIEQEIKMYSDDVVTSSYEKIIFNSFINHPIRIPIGGTIESIYKITKEDLYKCYNTFYNPNNMFVVITGNVDPNKVINTIKINQQKKKFIKQNRIRLKKIKENDNVSIEEERVKMNVTTNKVLISFKINIENTRLTNREITNYTGIFADTKFGATSKLCEELKESKIIIDDIEYSTIKTDQHILLIIEADVLDEEEFKKRILLEVENKKIDINEFERKKKSIISSCIYMSDSIFGLNNLVMNSIIFDNKMNYKIYDSLKKLNYKDFKKYISNIYFKNKSILYIEPNNVK